MIASVLSGICNYVTKMEMAKGSESFVKGIRDALYAHPEAAIFMACEASDEKLFSAVHLMWMWCGILSVTRWWRFSYCIFDSFVYGNHVFNECEDYAGSAAFYSSDHRLFGILLFADCQASFRRRMRQGALLPVWYRKISPVCGWFGLLERKSSDSTVSMKKMKNLQISGFA